MHTKGAKAAEPCRQRPRRGCPPCSYFRADQARADQACFKIRFLARRFNLCSVYSQKMTFRCSPQCLSVWDPPQESFCEEVRRKKNRRGLAITEINKERTPLSGLLWACLRGRRGKVFAERPGQGQIRCKTSEILQVGAKRNLHVAVPAHSCLLGTSETGPGLGDSVGWGGCERVFCGWREHITDAIQPVFELGFE